MKLNLENLISIIVPVYNSAKVVKRCIDSIINQNYSNWELIIVNDGSTDSSLSICEEYEKIDKRIHIVDKENGGVSSARNRGILQAKGNYICFVDSDDLIEPSFLSVLTSSIKESNPDLTICGMKKISANGDNESILPKKYCIKGKVAIANFVQRHYLEWLVSSPWGKLYKKSQLPIRGFDETISLGEDLKFNIEYFQKISSIEIVPEALYNYYDNEGSLTKSYKPGHLEAINEIYSITKKYIEGIEGVDLRLLKYVNYKLFSFCVSFMSQNMKLSNKQDEKEFIKQIVDNNNLQDAILSLPQLDIVRRLYVKAIARKNVNTLYVYSKIKQKFIDNLRQKHF